MSRTIRLRNIDDEVYLALSRRATEAGLSVPELMRREAIRLAKLPTTADWLERLSRSTPDIPTDSLATVSAHTRRESARRLAALGGTDPEATA